MSREKPQAQDFNKHPEQYRKDLNPDAMAGQNIGLPDTDPSKLGRSAYDLKAVHNLLSNFSDDDLKRIRVLPEGARLAQGATYIDLNNLDLGEFTATGDIVAGRDQWYVAKQDLDYNLWNLLRGIDTPERTGEIKEKTKKQKA